MRRRTTTTAALARSAIVAAVLVLAAGCTSGPHEPDGAALVGSWSEGTEEWVGDAMPVERAVVSTQEQLDAWLAALPAEGQQSMSSLTSVDLEEVFLVIGTYGRCTEHSVVVLDGDTIAFEVRNDEPNTNCYWSPYTIDAWSVPLASTDGVVPELAQED